MTRRRTKMAEKSKAVNQNGQSGIRSALVQAFESWKAPYDIRPEGVFGSLAKVKTDQVTVSSETLDLEFVVPFDDDMEPNEAEIVIYNLSSNTINQFKKDDAITIEAGYKGDTGVLFSGFISKVRTTYDGADKVTIIKALDDIKDHSIESMSFAAGTKASYILEQLINKTGIPVAVFSVRRDHTYKDSQTVDGDLMENISKYATVCGISVYVSKGKIYARYIKEGDNLNFAVSVETGMIGYPSSFTQEVKAEDFTDTVDGFEVEMLLQHRMCAGAIVELKSKVGNGTYRVCSGEHRFYQDEAVTLAKMY
jgi:hypothetical protein